MLVAVMSRSENKARSYAERHHVRKWYTDASELIEDPDVNAVYIATPPSSHATFAIMAMRAGKPLLHRETAGSELQRLHPHQPHQRADGCSLLCSLLSPLSSFFA